MFLFDEVIMRVTDSYWLFHLLSLFTTFLSIFRCLIVLPATKTFDPNGDITFWHEKWGIFSKSASIGEILWGKERKMQKTINLKDTKWEDYLHFCLLFILLCFFLSLSLSLPPHIPLSPQESQKSIWIRNIREEFQNQATPPNANGFREMQS